MPRVHSKLRDLLEEILYDDDLPGMYEVTTGGCIGIDFFVANWCHRHAVTIHTVFPPDLSKVDPDSSKVCNTSEDIPCLRPGDVSGYKRRNQRIVDLSNRLIAFPMYREDHAQSRRSGTWQTIRMGRRAGIMADADIHVLSEMQP